MQSKLDLSKVEEKSAPLTDMCGCSQCGWKGKVSDCQTEWESDGWEMPSYQVHICPVCEDGGCIDDYFFSEEMYKEYLEYLDNQCHKYEGN